MRRRGRDGRVDVTGERAERLDRLDLMRRTLVLGGGGVIAATALGGSSALAAAESELDGNAKKVVYEVACLGDTCRLWPYPGSEASGDLRGSEFVVEGRIYRRGTIPPGDGFDPFSKPSIGLWVCTGWVLLHPDRSSPEQFSWQLFAVGEFKPGERHPRNMLMSLGFDSSQPPDAVNERALTGGTGKYRGARGAHLLFHLGHNTTVIPEIGPAPNFRMTFLLV
jgi:hypothetical protein